MVTQALRAGEVFVGNYEILRTLGRGHFGVVYEARDRRHQRQVALKVVREPSDEARSSFLREARITINLDHPNVIRVYHSDEVEDRAYIVMELAQGSLAGRLADGKPVPAAEAADLLDGLAAALDYAHGQGVLHRDVKPGNILIGSKGLVKLADFGLARFADRTASESTGRLVGTPLYMAPELVAESPPRYAPAADIYALGAVVYEMLAGRPARVAEVREGVLLDAFFARPPRPPSAHNPEVGPAADRAVLRALARDPGTRPESAGELARDFRRSLAGPAEPPEDDARRVAEKMRRLAEAGHREQAFREGARHLQKAGSDPGVGPVLCETGRLLAAIGQHPAAESWFRQALALDPGSPAARSGLAASLRALGRGHEAERVLAEDGGE